MIRDAVITATDGSLMLAIPAFAPAIVIAGVVIFLAMRNRRHPEDSDEA